MKKSILSHHKLLAFFSVFLLSIIPFKLLAQSSHQLEILYSDAFDRRGRDDQLVATYKHSTDWNLGDSFFFIDMSHLGNYENAGNTYLEWQPRLSLGEILGDEPLSYGLFEDFYLIGEFDHVHNKRVSKNTYLAGLSTNLDLPGFIFFKMSLMIRNDPTISGHTQQVSMSWNYPFTIGEHNFSVEGFFDAANGEGNNPSYYHGQPQLLWKYSEQINFGIEYLYWHNKNGITGFNESAMQGMLRIIF